MTQHSQTMRRIVKAGIASVLHWSGTDDWLAALTGARGLPVVLGYHTVVEETPASNDGAFPGMMISRQMLAQHLDWLGRYFRIVSLDELGERLVRGDNHRKPVAAVTFDDGYRDVYEHAFPILKERGIPAAVFVVTDLIGTATIPLHDELYLLLAHGAVGGCPAVRNLAQFLQGLRIRFPEGEVLAGRLQSASEATRLLLRALPQAQLRRVVDALRGHIETDDRALKPKRTLTWGMLAEMSEAGITIGSHTRSHATLTRESARVVWEELVGSRHALERMLGTPVRHFAYPGGHFNQSVVRAVAGAGYHFGYSICFHRDPQHLLLTIPRTVLWETSCLDGHGRFSAVIMNCQVQGIFGDHCRDSHGPTAGIFTQSGENGQI